MAFDNINLDKGLYTAGKSFTQALESVDPSENYRGTALEGLDAYERQLKRFGIRVSGAHSDRIEKFFTSTQTAALLTEFITRTVTRGMEEASKLNNIVATTTQIEGRDYRSVSCENEALNPSVPDGEPLYPATITSKNSLVFIQKYGRYINASYEALRYQRLELFGVLLRRIGADIAEEQFINARTVLSMGDGNANTEAHSLSLPSDLTYEDLLSLWNMLSPFSLTTILASQTMAQKILSLPEMRDGSAGLDFHGSGNLVTPMGAELIKLPVDTNDFILAFDKNYALEMVKADGVIVDYDRIIDRQFHSAGISSSVGFAKIFKDAVYFMN